MREIVHIQIGECGNSIGNAFWTQIGKEHKILNDGKSDENKEQKNSESSLNQINTYYDNDGKKYIPRACLIDLDPTTLDVIKASSIGSLFKPDNFYFGSSGCGGNWPKGYYTEGAEAIDEVMNILRKESEHCDCIDGFQLVHSISGGTGGGFGTLILKKMEDRFCDKIISNFSVFPSPKSNINMAPLNASMTINQMLNNYASVLTYVIDNNALYNIMENVFKQKDPKYADLNWLIALLMAGITAPFRFECNERNTMRKRCINLVPFPRLHFMLCSHAPLYAENKKNEQKLTVAEISNQIWSVNNCFANVEFGDGKILSSMCLYRGSEAFSYTSNKLSVHSYSRSIDPIVFMNGFMRNSKIRKNIPSAIIDLCTKYIPYNVCVKQEEFKQSMYEYEYQMCRIKEKTIENNLIRWIPNSVNSICVQDNIDLQGTLIANTTSLQSVFSKISKQVNELYKRNNNNKFFQSERVSGMDENEFQEADKNVRDLMTEYQDKQDLGVNGYDHEE